MQKFDIYWVKWKYEDNLNLLTIRPGLVLSAANRNIIHLAKITITGLRVQFNDEYIIQKWREAGLFEASTLRLSKILEASPEDILDFIGHLDSIDKIEIEKLLAELRIKY